MSEHYNFKQCPQTWGKKLEELREKTLLFSFVRKDNAFCHSSLRDFVGKHQISWGSNHHDNKYFRLKAENHKYEIWEFVWVGGAKAEVYFQKEDVPF